MSPVLRRAAALASLLALAACGGGEVSRTACHQVRYCTEFEAEDLDVGDTNAMCGADGGTAMAECPAEGVVGVCTENSGGTKLVTHYYVADRLDLDQAACEGIGGTWTSQ